MLGVAHFQEHCFSVVCQIAVERLRFSRLAVGGAGGGGERLKVPRFAWSAATSPTHRNEAAVSSGAFVFCDLCVLSVSSQSQLVTAVYVTTSLFVVVALFFDEHVWVLPLFLQRNCACVFSLSGKGITATCYGIAAVARALRCVDRLLEKSVRGGTTIGRVAK